MRHFNLTKPDDDGLAEYIVTQESNSFGDQILSLKQYIRDGQSSRYEVIAKALCLEGCWMQVSEMRQWLEDELKKGETL